MLNSLIVKYLPKTFDSFELEENIMSLLQKAIEFDTLNLLIVSNPGCGKSSLINVIVNKYFNNHPKSAANILRISSIKEQGISYYRGDVRTFCQSLSIIPNKRKVVILDDLDLVSEHSQQVFRNCIDKYHKNVHFIASCTNAQKVIESLQSRLVSVQIPPLSRSSLSNIMSKIVHCENIVVSAEASEYILDVSNGSARALINYLEKMAILGRPINIETAHSLCTDISIHDYESYLKFCNDFNLQAAIDKLYSIYSNGFSVMDILNGLFRYLRNSKTFESEKLFRIIPIICKHIIAFSEIHEDKIELAFFTANVLKAFQSIN